MDPLFPAFAVPELNASSPLEPDAPPFALPTRTAPLLVCVPSPLVATSVPPVAAVLRPAAALSLPPDPLVPLPALTTLSLIHI